jgi:cellulose synthase/poly-beta-1,6-N-acetylglucosamine synthase-like glycosyltransferase
MPSWLAWTSIVFASFVLAELIRMNLLLIRVLKREPTIPITLPSDRLPLLSVIIPAKDEEHGIEYTVESLLSSEGVPLELILVNDRSSDKTGEIMESLAKKDSRISIITVKELPPGWTGKTHAMSMGVQKAKGDVLLFTDADAVAPRDTLRRALDYLLRNKLDMLSLLPGFTARGFSENVVHLHLALGFSYFNPILDVNDKSKSAAMASGCFIMMTRTAYDRVGGWEAFRTEVSEDVAMSRGVKAMGMNMTLIRGDRLVQTKPFRNVLEVGSFWKRTFYGGLRKSVPKLLWLGWNYASLSLIFLLAAASGLLWIAGQANALTTAVFIVTTLASAAVIIPSIFLIAQEKSSWVYGLMAPVGIFISTFIVLNTVIAVVAHQGIPWRGSLYK